MNKNLLALIALTFALVGCGDSDKDKAEKAADDGNAIIAQMDSTLTSLQNKGVYLLKYGNGCKYDDDMTDEGKASARAELLQIQNYGQRVLQIIDRDDVYLVTGSESEIQDIVESAAKCHSELN